MKANTRSKRVKITAVLVGWVAALTLTSTQSAQTQS